MKNILIVGSGGQIGTELVKKLRAKYGNEHVVASDLRQLTGEIAENGPFERIDSTQIMQIVDVVKKYNIDTIYNLAAILSATAEKNPMLGWNVGIGSLVNCLEVARTFGCAVFTPSSIGAFGPSTPRDNTPQDTIQRPNTIYGVTKVTGELLTTTSHVLALTHAQFASLDLSQTSLCQAAAQQTTPLKSTTQL